MAKKQPKTIQFDTYTAGIFGRTEGYANRVRQLYAQAVTELLKIAQSQDVGENEMFEFDKMPKKLRNEANKVLRLLYTSVFNEVQHGIRAEWEYANLSNDIIIKRAFGDAVFKNEGNHFARWFGRNQQALEAFLKRKAGPERLGLSDRIWNYTGQLKDEMELALTVSMGQGESASTMSRKVRQYLQEPDRLFRHVKGKDGKMVWSKAAKAYLKEHDVGKGQYLSSYKNAMRLTRTETNMAYRQSDHDRWQQMDFVLGIHIQRAHRDDNDKNEICELLQGDYPKGFDFTGWHPQCRCIATPILATPEEMAAMRKALKEGKDPRSVLAPGRYITEPPAAFTQWISDNRERIENAKSVPYFIRDNFKDGNIDKGYSWVKTKKQKTQEEKNAIIEKWNERKRHNTLITKMGNNVYNVAAGYPDIDTSDLVTAINNGNVSKIEEYSRTIAKQVAGLNKELRGMESIIDNPKQWLAQGFKVADLQKVHTAVENNIQKWQDTYATDTFIKGKYSSVEDYLLHKLSYEIAYVADPSKFKAGATQYPTWEIAQNAYLKKQTNVQDILVWRDIQSQYALLSAKLSNGMYASQIAKLDKAITNKQKDAAQDAIAELQSWVDINDVLQEALTFQTKSQPYLNLIAQLKQNIQSEKLTAALSTVLSMQQKRRELKKAADRRNKGKVISVQFNAADYTEEAKAAAIWCKKASESHKNWDADSEQVWNNATTNEQEAWKAYTGGFGHMNRPLRGYQGSWDEKNYKGVGNVDLNFENGEAHIKDLYNLCNKSTFNTNRWFQRGIGTWEGVEGFFGKKPLTREMLRGMVGQIVQDYAFVSCGSAKGTGFSGLILNIYCPKGTKGFYACPHSYFGDHENESILQAGTQFRITKVEAPDYGTCYVDVEVVGYIQHPSL